MGGVLRCGGCGAGTRAPEPLGEVWMFPVYSDLAETRRHLAAGVRSVSSKAVNAPLAALAGALAFAAVCLSVPVASAADNPSPGLRAMEGFDVAADRPQAVENRFFLKTNRFEIAPIVGYVPNNPFAVRYVGGGMLAFHFTETIAAQAQISYSPDLGENDLKGLVGVLLDRAFNAGADVGFQQPLDKVQLSAAFGAAWAPLYGKINLVGETVLNFDFYGFAGAAMISKHNFIATYDEAGVETGDVVNLQPDQNQPNEVLVAPVLGIGQNYFLNQMMSFKIDVRAAFYIDDKPQYDPEIPPTEKQLYNNLILSGGVAFFFPRMKPRLYDF